MGHLFSHLFGLTGKTFIYPPPAPIGLHLPFYIGLSPCTCWMQAASLAKTGLKTNGTFQNQFNVIENKPGAIL